MDNKDEISDDLSISISELSALPRSSLVDTILRLQKRCMEFQKNIIELQFELEEKQSFYIDEKKIWQEKNENLEIGTSSLQTKLQHEETRVRELEKKIKTMSLSSENLLAEPELPKINAALAADIKSKIILKPKWSESVRINRKIYLKICEAKDLPKNTSLLRSSVTDKIESPTYFASISLDDKEVGKTESISKTTLWNQEFQIIVDNQFENMIITVWNKGLVKAVFKDETIAVARLQRDLICKDQERHEEWFPLEFAKKQKDSSLGSIQLEISLTAKANEGLVTLTVKVVSCRNLTNREAESIYPYVALHILPDEDLITTKQTSVSPDTFDPEFNETFTFSLERHQIVDGKLHASIWNSNVSKLDRSAEHDFLGQALISLVDFTVKESKEEEEIRSFPLSGQFLQSMYSNKSKKVTLGKNFGKLTRSQTSLASMIRSISSSNAIESVHSGSIRIAYRYYEELLLPYGAYNDLLHLLTEENLIILTAVGSVCEIDRLQEVAQTSLNIFQSQGISVSFINQLISSEVNSTKDPNTIFRGNSIATKALDYFMKLVARQYLISVLKKPIDEICAEKKNCELDPTRIDVNKVDTQLNLKNLTNYINKILDSIFNSLSQCPAPLRDIFGHMQSEVSQRFSDEPLIRYISVSGFIFLRFFCPAILGPKLFNLRDDIPDPVVGRTLTMIAKVLQNLANLCDFGQKEPFMIDMNPFISEKKESMKLFIDTLSNNLSSTVKRIGELETKIGQELKIVEGLDAINQATPKNDKKHRHLIQDRLSESKDKIHSMKVELERLKKLRDHLSESQDNQSPAQEFDYANKFNFDVEAELARLHHHLVAKRTQVVNMLENSSDAMKSITARNLCNVLDELDQMKQRLQHRRN